MRAHELGRLWQSDATLTVQPTGGEGGGGGSEGGEGGGGEGGGGEGGGEGGGGEGGGNGVGGGEGGGAGVRRTRLLVGAPSTESGSAPWRRRPADRLHRCSAPCACRSGSEVGAG